jgi:hypothetical protein
MTAYTVPMGTSNGQSDGEKNAKLARRKSNKTPPRTGAKSTPSAKFTSIRNDHGRGE